MSEIPVSVVGTVVSDVRTLETKSGAQLASFRLAAHSRRFNRTTNTWVDGDTSFMTVNCWRSLANNVMTSVSKGDPVVVTGRLKVRDWTNDERSGTSVELEAISVGHDLARGTTAFARPAKEHSAIDPWSTSTADELTALATSAGVSVETMDSELLDVDGSEVSARKSA